jgi:hypothetical protein
MRITKNDLIKEISTVNEILKNSGSRYFYRYQHRNFYHAVDLCKQELDHVACVTCLDCAEPPRILIEKLKTDYIYYINTK